MTDAADDVGCCGTRAGPVGVLSEQPLSEKLTFSEPIVAAPVFELLLPKKLRDLKMGKNTYICLICHKNCALVSI